MSAATLVLAISSIKLWAIIFVVITFAIYITIAMLTRAKSTSQFYVAEQSIPAPANGAAIAADWMSAASFISMAGLISFLGFDGAIYLLGWTGGYVLLALLLAPYLRKYGKYTVPDFIGDRYSDIARFVAVFAAIFVSFTYVAGQMRGVGIVFSLFIALLYTTAPAVAVYAKTNLLQDAQENSIANQPTWVKNWEETGLISIADQNGNGRIDSVTNSKGDGEMLVDPDIMVLANPEIAGLPAPVVGLVAAGGLAAALSTAAGLLLVIGAAVGHDLFYKFVKKDATEGQRLLAGRVGVLLAVLAAGWFGVHPPAFVGQVVAFAFGLAAASFFPAIVLGIFWKRANAPGAISGLVCGLGFTALYMWATLYGGMEPWFGISPEGIGAVGMAINFIVTIAVSSFTREPSPEIQALVEEVRHPRIGEDIAPTPTPAPAPARGR